MQHLIFTAPTEVNGAGNLHGILFSRLLLHVKPTNNLYTLKCHFSSMQESANDKEVKKIQARKEKEAADRPEFFKLSK